MIGTWRTKELPKQRKSYFDENKKVKCQNVNVGDVVKVKSPVGRAPFSKFTHDYKVVKLFKRAVKLDDGRIWNCSRVINVNTESKEEELTSGGRKEELKCENMSNDVKEKAFKEMHQKEQVCGQRKYRIN